ncbi:TonB-dependent receptor [Amorphus orientalis]|uniref:Outer membrane receptor protein involved in Fe transport n=1 Tax=Amorphus orientalis TaxID=649198 RepID=A0AAE4AUI9_9HYPH|nr:TonB-dependent receptor [Amorphus orientalis]MDQ0317503.1 outer membrane receptor protein involved in Fe transport [Amorphus orientalis]
MRPKIRNRHLREAGALFALALGAAHGINAAHAQSAEPPADAAIVPDDGVIALGEIIVTGERVDRALADTVTPVTVIPADNPMVQTPTSDINDVATIAPNVYNTSRTEPPNVRGIQGGGAGGLVSSFAVGALPRLPIIVDGVARTPTLTNTLGMSLWDVEQIEVLRGPQNLLRGRLGLAGAIIVDTYDPQPDFGMALQGGLEFDAFNNPAFTLNGMLNAPLSQDWAVRGTFEITDGEDPRETLDPANGFINDYDQIRLRAKLGGRVEHGLGVTDVLVLGEYEHGTAPQARSQINDLSYTNPATGQTGGPLRDRLVDATRTRAFDNDGAVISLQTSTLTDIGTFETFTSGTFTGFESVPRQIEPTRFDFEEGTFSNDLIYTFGPAGDLIAGEFGGLVGLSYEYRHSVTDFDGAITGKLDVTSQQAATFADMRYGLTDRLNLLAGLRVNVFQDDRSQTSRVLLPIPGAPPVVGESTLDDTETVLLPSVGVAYDIDPRQTVGLTLRRGYNPGGASVNFFTGEPFFYDSETVWTTEAVYRGRFMEDRLGINVSAFYNRFQDLQLYGETIPGNRFTLQVINVPDAQSYGLELETDWRAREWLTLGGSLGLLQNEILDSVGTRQDLDGNRFGQDPIITASLQAIAEVAPGVSVDGRVRYVGPVENDFNNIALDEVGDYATIDVGATADWKNLSARAYVNNVTNTQGVTSRVGGGYVSVIDPRTFGVSLTARF